MAWQHDQPPIEYLKRRIIYYKKKRGSIRGLLKDNDMMKRYTKKDIQNAVDRIESRMKEFKEAIDILQIEQLKNMALKPNNNY